MTTIPIGTRLVGDGEPVFVIAEIGINHNGDLDIAKRLIDIAADAGCDAVKFQKRTPDVCVPPDQRGVERDTPWGRMTYIDYRHKVEFGPFEYEQIATHARSRRLKWFVSCWDEPAVDFMEQFDPPCYKLASASVTDSPLLTRLAATGRPIIVSSGMSTMDEVRDAVSAVPLGRRLLAHSTSTYPCPPDELNLRVIPELAREFDVPIGYSGHEVGLQTTVAAVALGATFVERHVTVDRAMWGSDQAASVEPQGLDRLVRDIRTVEAALGDGIKRVYDSELAARRKLRRVDNAGRQ